MSARAMVRRTVQWTVSATIGCFPGECRWCRAQMPEPADEDVVAFARANPGQNFMHAGSDWIPSGWRRVDGEAICSGCAHRFDGLRVERGLV